MTNATKLAEYINAELSSDIQEILVTRESATKYTLFGKYTILLNKRGFYTVFSTKTKSYYEFSTLKIATAWCVLDHAEKYVDGNRLENLDLKLSSIAVDIAVHKNMIKNAIHDDTKLISVTKLQEDNHRRRQTLREINFYINNSRELQEQRFRAKASKFNYL